MLIEVDFLDNLIDKKILYHLDDNSRQSFAQLGRKVGLHRTNVINRVKKLEKDGFIFKFFTFIDGTKLGYTYLRYYFEWQYTSPEIKKKIIHSFVNCPYSSYITELEGRYGLAACFAVRNFYDFHRFFNKTLKQYKDYFTKQVFSVWCYDKAYPLSFLLYEDSKKRPDLENMVMFGGGPVVKTDEFKILGPGVFNTMDFI